MVKRFHKYESCYDSCDVCHSSHGWNFCQCGQSLDDMVDGVTKSRDAWRVEILCFQVKIMKYIEWLLYSILDSKVSLENVIK